MLSDKEFAVCGVSPTRGTAETFLDAVTVWINKPHVANRRLCGTKLLRVIITDSPDIAQNVATECIADEHGSRKKDRVWNHEESILLEVNLRESSCERFVLVLRELLPKQTNKYPSLLEAVIYDKETRSVGFYPVKYNYKNCENEKKDISSEIAYRWTYVTQGNASIQLEVSHGSLADDSSTSQPQVTVQWLRDTLTPKVARWSEESNLNTSITSLRLVGVDRYSQMYAMLKEKYGAQLVQDWTEKTDPHKFVYEDIAIATYLLLLWEDDRKRLSLEKKQSFVDLGCGNGLLVYILTKEGHKGLGIDLRHRNIWDTYDSDVQLEERSVTPSADNLFPDYDWLIGNHSDELTPWIPVIAARSSYTCNYFVLPCCHHDFNRRFSNKVKGMSQYRAYLAYITQVGEVCGFQVEEDTLRIPSTKRVCQIGRHRTYTLKQEEVADKKRQDFISARCATKLGSNAKSARQLSASSDNTHDKTDRHTENLTQKRQHSSDCDAEHVDSRSDTLTHDVPVAKASCSFVSVETKEHDALVTTADNNHDTSVAKADDKHDASVNEISVEKADLVWVTNFQARDSVERVRNCQSVGVATKDKVVQAVFEVVLTADDATEAVTQDGKTWRKGGSVPLSVVAQMLDKSTREELKSECGGVQTLLRNHNHIFQVSGGKVQLRDFSVDNPWSQRAKAKGKSRKVDPASRYKTALCWFHDKHPDGCPRRTENCTFAHGAGELRPRDHDR